MAPITLQHNAHSNQVSLCKTLRVRRANWVCSVRTVDPLDAGRVDVMPQPQLLEPTSDAGVSLRCLDRSAGQGRQLPHVGFDNNHYSVPRLHAFTTVTAEFGRTGVGNSKRGTSVPTSVPKTGVAVLHKDFTSLCASAATNGDR
jgi:hypothetical protein